MMAKVAPDAANSLTTDRASLLAVEIVTTGFAGHRFLRQHRDQDFAVLRQLTPREYCTRVVDQNIYARLLIGDLSRYPFHFLQAQEIGKMYRMGNTRGAAA